jgi:hypothetical protein
VRIFAFPCGLSVLDPVDVPHCMQRYSYRLLEGRISNNRSRVGVATRHRGQYRSEALSDLNWSLESPVAGCGRPPEAR